MAEPEEKLSKRALRRAKQRLENPARAAKMHAARMTYTRVNESASDHAAAFNIGCSGWFYWDWRDTFYPSTLTTSQWFEYYRKHFKTVELNAPFYSWPTVATVASWKRQAGKGRFVYTVKVNELITHVKSFKGTRTLMRDFGLIADLLGPHMGCFLFQLPASFRYSPARLKAILSQLEPARRNVVEFRHASWWREDVYKAFRKAGAIFCSCSGPKLPDELVRTADDIYVRFHGTQKWYRHDYSADELKVWAERIKESGAKRVWIYFNNDFNGFAIKNARMLGRLLRK